MVSLNILNAVGCVGAVASAALLIANNQYTPDPSAPVHATGPTTGPAAKVSVSPEQARANDVMARYDSEYRAGSLQGIDIGNLQRCVSGADKESWIKYTGGFEHNPNNSTVLVVDLGHGEDTLVDGAISPYTMGTSYGKIKDPNLASVLAEGIISAQGGGDKAKITHKIADLIKDLVEERQEKVARRNAEKGSSINPDPFFEMGAFADEIIDRIDAKHKGAVRKAIYQTMNARNLIMTETSVVDALAVAVREEAAKQGIMVVFTRTPMAEGVSLQGMDYRKAIAYRAGVSAYFAQNGYNVMSVSFHADSLPSDAFHTRSTAYAYAPKRGAAPSFALAGQLSTNIANSYRQADPGLLAAAANPQSPNDPARIAVYENMMAADSRPGTANYALVRCSVNGVLLETYQLGSYVGRVRADNMRSNPLFAQKTAKSVVDAVRETLQQLQARRPATPQRVAAVR